MKNFIANAINYILFCICLYPVIVFGNIFGWLILSFLSISILYFLSKCKKEAKDIQLLSIKMFTINFGFLSFWFLYFMFNVSIGEPNFHDLFLYLLLLMVYTGLAAIYVYEYYPIELNHIKFVSDNMHNEKNQ